jgi:hypothetical protein
MIRLRILACRLEVHNYFFRLLWAGQAEFTVKDLKAGYHAFSLLGTDAKGNIRPSTQCW